jgi:hypothetical protein
MEWIWFTAVTVTVALCSFNLAVSCPVNFNNLCADIEKPMPSGSRETQVIERMMDARNHMDWPFHPNVSVDEKEDRAYPSAASENMIKSGFYNSPEDARSYTHTWKSNHLCKWYYHSFNYNGTILPSGMREAVLVDDSDDYLTIEHPGTDESVVCQCRAIVIPIKTLHFDQCKHSEEKWAFSTNLNITVGFTCVHVID